MKSGLGPKAPPPHCGFNPSKCFFFILFFLNFPKEKTNKKVIESRPSPKYGYFYCKYIKKKKQEINFKKP